MIGAAAAFLIGVVIAFLIPPIAALKASSEIVSFVSLLMAGLLPAMILTATVLRGDRYSAARIRSYGDALRHQLSFWAFLFVMAIVAVFALTGAKMLVDWDVPSLTYKKFVFDFPKDLILRLLIGVSFGSTAIILLRLWPAYKGLRSILDLNVQTAELQAIDNDRKLNDQMDKKGERLGSVASPEPEDW